MTATLTRPAAPAARTAYRVPALDVVIPVSAEHPDLEPCVRRLHAYLTGIFPLPFRITLAGRATAIPARAGRLEADLPEVRVACLPETDRNQALLPETDRNQALRAAWLRSDALVLAYLGADPAADLTVLLPLVAPLLSGHSDLATGTWTTRAGRAPGPEFVSGGYHVLLRWLLRTRFSGAGCGFKAIRREAGRPLLPLVETPAGSSTPNCSSSPSGLDCGSPRCRSTGLGPAHGAATCAVPSGSAGRWPPGDGRSRLCARNSAVRR